MACVDIVYLTYGTIQTLAWASVPSPCLLRVLQMCTCLRSLLSSTRSWPWANQCRKICQAALVLREGDRKIFCGCGRVFLSREGQKGWYSGPRGGEEWWWASTFCILTPHSQVFMSFQDVYHPYTVAAVGIRIFLWMVGALLGVKGKNYLTSLRLPVTSKAR